MNRREAGGKEPGDLRRSDVSISDKRAASLAKRLHGSVVMFFGRCCFMARLAPRRPEKLRQTISNWDLVSHVCSRQQSRSLSFPPRVLFFGEPLRGKLSCFHVKGPLLSVCFPGCLKLFTMHGAFHCLSVRVCVCVQQRERGT